MGEPLPGSVDVRDMLCAQALAVVAAAAKGLPSGVALTVLFNAQDVKRDLLTWAVSQGHQAIEVGSGALRLVKV